MSRRSPATSTASNKLFKPSWIVLNRARTITGGRHETPVDLTPDDWLQAVRLTFGGSPDVVSVAVELVRRYQPSLGLSSPRVEELALTLHMSRRGVGRAMQSLRSAGAVSRIPVGWLPNRAQRSARRMAPRGLVTRFMMGWALDVLEAHSTITLNDEWRVVPDDRFWLLQHRPADVDDFVTVARCRSRRDLITTARIHARSVSIGALAQLKTLPNQPETESAAPLQKGRRGVFADREEINSPAHDNSADSQSQIADRTRLQET